MALRREANRLSAGEQAARKHRMSKPAIDTVDFEVLGAVNSGRPLCAKTGHSRTA